MWHIETADLIEKAADWLTNHTHIKGELWHWTGPKCDIPSPWFGPMVMDDLDKSPPTCACALGAIVLKASLDDRKVWERADLGVYGIPGTEHRIHRVTQIFRKRYGIGLTSYNDAPETRKEDVIERLREFASWVRSQPGLEDPKAQIERAPGWVT